MDRVVQSVIKEEKESNVLNDLIDRIERERARRAVPDDGRGPAMVGWL
ncbi:MAG: hypothetical protein GTO14_12905 [Anaerolineales bacterium]|nr:hypothetical protein [Anaerolineales bacterium]